MTRADPAVASVFALRCIECGARYEEGPERYVCSRCAAAQALGGSTRGLLEVVHAQPPKAWPAAPIGSRAWVAPFLPVAAHQLPTAAVGGTPLLPVARLRRALGMPDLWLKDDTRNPSGSTKDRASALVVAKAREYGCQTVATASTGNAATALSAMAAVVGLQAVVFVPADAPVGKLTQMASYGATVLRIDGTYDEAFELCGQACARFGWYNRNTAFNPFTIEGKKTVSLEIAAALAPEVPDVVVVPVGDGVIISGVAKGFEDLERGGLIGRRPRLLAVQPAGSSAIADAFARGDDAATPLDQAETVADSLKVCAPRGGHAALRALRASDGAAVVVSDEAILDAIPRLARATGVFAEPAAAAALAGLEAARDRGLVDASERVVLLITGNGLKDIAAAARSIGESTPIAPSLDAVAEWLKQSPPPPGS